MAQKKNSKGQTKKDAKPAGKNGKKAEGSSGSSFFTWFMVLALLGVWTSVAVVWFGLVDYDDVLAKAKEFRYNISEVLQGKLGAYDADGDGDFDVEDAKVLLGRCTDLPHLQKEALKEQLRMIHEKIEAKKIAKMALAEVRSIIAKEEAQKQAAREEELKMEATAQKAKERTEAQLQEEVGKRAREEEREKKKEVERREKAKKEKAEKERLTKEKERKEKEKLTKEKEREEKEKTKQGREEKPVKKSQNKKPERSEPSEEETKKKKPKLLNKFDKTIKAEIDAAEKLRKKGKVEDAMRAFEALVEKYPGSPRCRYGKAQVLAEAPEDGFAKVHYGFILKSENKIAESIPFLREGLESGDPGTDDGRFYFHLGDALQRVGDDSAYKWYELGHQRGHFASVWQRSLYNVDGLRAQPWWTPKETGYTDLVKTLERNWRTIRDEALAVMDATSGLFLPEDENLREKGEWGQFTLWQQGRKVDKSCQSVPKTCALMERYPEATGCKRGQIKYSVMHPGTHVWPHTGPTNCRLRMHLGLVIPSQGCRIRCTNETRAWEEGKVLIFDDSFEHEVWQEADRYRLIFIVDVWHPELTQYQRKTLSPI
uniref:Aspartate beta-hydroxylase n=1 Tax=Scleropages formosus TaxID=113540 RepID=A0A8C9RUF2_SCLFO